MYNEFVLSGYRINHYSWKSLVKSICHTHNETANIWTHFLPGLVFLLFIIAGWLCKPGFLLFGSKSLSRKAEEDQGNFGLNLTPFTGKFLDSFYTKCCHPVDNKKDTDMTQPNSCLSESLSSHLKDLQAVEERLRAQAQEALESSFMYRVGFT